MSETVVDGAYWPREGMMMPRVGIWLWGGVVLSDAVGWGLWDTGLDRDNAPGSGGRVCGLLGVGCENIGRLPSRSSIRS